jgi:ELWxxDGT repeat protein
MTAAGSKLFFRADDDKHGSELWITDGTTSATVQVADINKKPMSSLTADASFVKAGGKYFFTAYTEWTNSYWVTDGTAAGTKSLEIPVTRDNGIVAFGDSVLIKGNYNVSNALIITDGTSEGTEELLTSEYIYNVMVVDDLIYFIADDTGTAYLYVSDGTAAGTHALRNSDDNRFVEPSYLTKVGSDLYFMLIDFMGISRLYVTDGTADGTLLIKEMEFTEAASIRGFAGTEDKLIFNLVSDDAGSELWVSNGTLAGTVMLKNIADDSDRVVSSYPDDFRSVDGKVFFTAATEEAGEELWITDGTESGTHMVVDGAPGESGSAIEMFGSVGNKLYYTSTVVPMDLSGETVYASPRGDIRRFDGKIMVAYTDMDMVQTIDTGLAADFFEPNYPNLGLDFEEEDYMLIWYTSVDLPSSLLKIMGSSFMTALQTDGVMINNDAE